ncbi:filamentous hemagglutinin N-terminal domain-containing protein, partial [Kinneretia asaccharophila]
MNAHCFKTVFSTRLGALVAVGEHALTQGKAGSGAGGSGVGIGAGAGSGAWSYVGAVAVGLALTSAAWAQAGAPALPSGAQLAQGAATVQTVAPGQMQIVQGSDRAVLNWQSFSVGSGGLVKIDQPTAQSMLLNRVVGADASQILGRVQANGQVVLVNPNGVVFGKDGSVSASSFTASTLGISDADFMAGRLNFSRNGSQAGVRNEGRLQSEAGGYVALLGAKVENAGEIATRGGAAVLAAAEQVSIALSGTGKIRLALSPAAVDMAVSNAKEGVIVSEGGQVLLRAQAVNQAVASLLQSGKIDASAGQGGEVSLLTDGGLIKVDGSILANSTQDDKGGDIVIGRDLQTGVLAKRTDVSGSQLSSRGGFIETSGDWLKTDAVKVEAGLWLLDPADIVIDNFSGSNSNIGTSTSAPTTSYTPVSGAAASQIDVGVINTALASGNVVITTTNTGTAGAGNGDITLNAPISFAGSGSGSVGNLTLTADRDIILNASISNTYRTTLTATRDLRINENISAQDGITARAGRDVYVMKNFGGGTASSIEAAYKGGTPANGWMTGTGQVILDPAAVLSYNYALTLNSGLGYTSSGSTDTSNGARVNFSDSQLNWNNGANPGGWVRLRGFQDVSLSNARGGSAAVTIPSGTLEVQARNITVGTNLSAADMTLNAGMFESTAGATLGQYNNGNWINKQGALTLGSSVLGYSGVLDLRSGIANAGTGARTSIAGSNVAWSNSAAGALRLYGFDTVTTSSDVRAGSVDVFSNQINQQGNINSAGSVRLVAASFDAAGNPLGSLAGNTTTPTGWQNLKGEIDISAGKTITGTSFDLRSGVNSSNTLLRKDFDAAQTLIGVGGTLSSSTASSLYLAGFRDVKLPNFTDITGAGSYQVFARNIDASTIPAGKFNAFTLRLWAGLYQDQLGVNRYSFNQVGRNGVGMGGDNNNAGTITLPSSLMVQSSVLDLSSGLTGVSGSQRVNFSPSSLGPYVDPSNPTRYTGAYYTTSGGVNTQRQGGARYLNLHGFNTVNLPATPLNYEQVDIGANNVVINADINAGQGSWWPLPFYLYIQAGTYNPTTGVSGGTNAGSVSFNNDPVIRVQGYTPAGFYGTASSPLGFNSYLQIINGATAADFTARLGYTKADYSAGGTGVFTNLTLQNFSNTRLQLENASDKITVKDYNGTGSINITQASGATGAIRIFNDLSAENTITLNAGNGSIRMGSQVAKAPTISLTTGANSAANIDADTLNVTSKNLGSTLVVNEANNVTLANSGANTDTGNIEINARGELSLGANFTRSGAGNTASLTLRADAQFGNTLDTSTGNWQSQTLNTVFSSYNNGTTGEAGGDGYGAIRVSSAQPTLVLPSFRQVAVVDAAAGFTTPASNTSYFRPDGTLYPNSTLLPQGSIIVLGAGVSPTAAMDLMTASGSPYRIKSTVTQGGWSVTAANTFFNSSGVAYASGTLLPVGTEVYYKTSTAAPSGNITNTYPNGGNNGQQLLYVVGGYTTTNSVNTVPDYVSKGTSFTASYNFGGLSASLASSATTIGGDTPVDVSQAANYYGNPVSGTNSRLHMSGQFYTFNPSGVLSSTGYLDGTQAAPTQINQLATGTGNNSTTGNGWDTRWGTATITTAGGDLRLFSGPRHALAGPGYGVGDPADLNIFNNPVTNDFVNTKSIKDSAFALNAGTGNLVALGFRDVLLDPSGTLSSSGNVTIGAARDMVLNNNSNLGGSGSLTTLLAGGMITNKVGGVYNTLGASTGAGASNLMVLAGGGVDLRTNMASVVGSLQDNPLMTGVLAGGMAPTGSFNIIGSNNQTAGLVVGDSFTNALVNDVTFDGTAGILYSASTPLSRTGINTKPNASGSGSVTGNYGAVTLSTAGNTGTAADIVVNGAINTQPTGGNVQLTAQRHVLQAADVRAGAGDVSLTASSGSISRTAGTVGGNDVVLSAATTIGSSSQSISTAADTLGLNSAGNQFVSESNDVTLAASTTGNGAVVVSAGGTLTVGSASGLSGISSGSGEVNLKGNALAVNANIATTSNAFLEAVGNITANGAGRISAAAAVLSAGGSMGSAGSRVLTAVQRLALNANGDSSTTAFVSDLDGVQLSAKAPNGGGLDVQSASGNLVLDRFSLTPGAANAQGYVAPTSSSVGVDGTGNVSLQAVAGMVDVAKDLRAAGTVRVQGKTADGSTAVMLRSGVSLSNSATAGQSTTLLAEQGNIAAEGPASVTAGTGAGVIQLLAGSDASSAGSVDGSNLTITQSGAGTAQGNNGTVGVLVQTTGSGDVMGPKVINNGSGNVVLSAGSALAAGNAAGGQVKTVSGNSTSQLGGGKTYVYTGAAASSGDLELIDSSFSTLYLSQVGSNLANARTNTDFAAGPQHNSGSNSQVMVRERLSFTDKVNAAQLRITYGDADPSSTAVKDALKAANQLNGSSIVETVLAGSNSYQVTRAAIIDDLTVTDPAANGSPRHAGTQANGFASGYNYGLAGNNFEVNTATGTAKLFVDPKRVTLTASKTYDGSTDMTGYVTISGLVGGQTLNYSGARANGKNVSAGVKAEFISAITLADGTGANAGLASDYILPDLTRSSDNNSAAVTARTVTLNASKSYDGKTGLSGNQLVIGNLVSGETLTYQDAQLNSKNVWEADHVSAVTLLDGSGGGLASNYAAPDLSKKTSGINEAKVDKARLSVAITGEARKVYDGGTEAQLSSSNFAVAGLAEGDAASIGFADPAKPVMGHYASKNVRDNTEANKGRVTAAVDNSLVQLTQGDARNYDLLMGDASGIVGVITPKEASVDGTATSKMYNGQDQSQAPAQLTGFIEADLSAGRIGVVGVATGRNVGTYTSNLSVEGEDAGNYVVTVRNADLTITKNNQARVVLTANSDIKQYNGAMQSVSGFTAEGLVGSDTADNIGAQAGASGRNAGVYGTSFSNTDQLKANYENVELKDGALTINKN